MPQLYHHRFKFVMSYFSQFRDGKSGLFPGTRLFWVYEGLSQLSKSHVRFSQAMPP